MSLKKLSIDTIFYGAVSALKSLAPILLLPFLTVYLTPSEYGELSIIEVTILFLMPFISFSSHSSIKVEYFKLSELQLKEYISNAIVLSLLSFLCFFTIAFIFTEYISEKLNIAPIVVYLLPLFAFLRLLGEILTALFHVKEKRIQFATFNLSQTISDLGLSILFVTFLHYGYLGRLGGAYITFFFASIFSLFLLRKYNLFHFKFSSTYFKEILSFGLPLIPHAIGGTILAMSDRYFISYYVDLEQLGFYTVAYQLSAFMLLIATSVNLAWTPMCFKLLKDGFSSTINEIKKILVILVLFFLTVGLILFWKMDLLFLIFSDESFYLAKDYYPYLLLGFIFQSIYIVFSIILFYEKKTAVLGRITFAAATFNIILNYFLIHTYSVIGVAYSTAISWFVFSVIIIFVACKKLDNFKKRKN